MLKVVSEDDDDEAFLLQDEESSAASVDLNCDDDISIEPIDDIPESGRRTKTIEDYGLENDIFTKSDLKEWKIKEQKLVDMFKNGYYRCKHKNCDVYDQICELYRPYISEEHLRQLNHPFSTQHNETMNHSVLVFAPKGKTYSKTESLETRVAIAASIQILGYEAFWELIYEDFRVSFDENLRTDLRNMDKKKEKISTDKSREIKKKSKTVGQFDRRTQQRHSSTEKWVNGLIRRCIQGSTTKCKATKLT